MSGITEQVPLPLPPSDPFSLQYFISHTGAAEALQVLESALERCCAAKGASASVFLHGPAGSGKTHLCTAFARQAIKRGLCTAEVFTCELGEAAASPILHEPGEFVGRYEQVRTGGGLIIITSRSGPYDVSDNPHLRSRFCAGSVVQLAYPREEELRPLLASLASRKNLKLSERSIEYLLRRLPADPLSFDNIFARINELSLGQGCPAGLAVVRRAVEAGEQ